MTFAIGDKNRPLRRLTRTWAVRASALLCLLAVAILAGCSSSGTPSIQQLINGTPPPGEPKLSTGLITMGHAVSDLDLEAMVPPGGQWLTRGPQHRTGATSFTLSLAPLHGHPGVIHTAFLCLDAHGSSIAADYSWFGQASIMACDDSPDNRSVFTFDLANSDKSVMPQIELPDGASWEVFAWLAPPQRPAAGTSAAGAGLARFTGYGLTFTYPRSWYSLAPAQRGAYHATTLAFESTAPLRDTGRVPIAALPPGGVLVDWSITGPPGTGPAAERGQPQTIAGHQAWLSSRAAASDPACRSTPGASRLVEATISASPRLSYQMLACISGPDTSQSVNSVMAMLSSLRLGRDPGA